MKNPYNENMNEFNHLKLNAAIAGSGLTQSRVAELMGVHHNTVSAWVTGATPPRPLRLIELLERLGWSDEQLKQARIIEWYAPNRIKNRPSPFFPSPSVSEQKSPPLTSE